MLAITAASRIAPIAGCMYVCAIDAAALCMVSAYCMFGALYLFYCLGSPLSLCCLLSIELVNIQHATTPSCGLQVLGTLLSPVPSARLRPTLVEGTWRRVNLANLVTPAQWEAAAPRTATPLTSALREQVSTGLNRKFLLQCGLPPELTASQHCMSQASSVFKCCCC
jgi:hypothetical protein